MMTCLEQKFEAREDCLMPWKQKNPLTKTCDRRAYLNFLEELKRTPTFQKFQKMTGCIHSCKQRVRQLFFVKILLVIT